ncbi:UDP-N-acetylmuramate--L-alanine ligase [Homoserinimonas hongtaonis]|uniref:UDP-N-acetylmuramate--L-alanine ligase n=1 Tax=Homoserinimonas hongtaonis TaxID=2079791 RepID=A0A2U1SY64_9MICO|nr:UDP-N-acetylmuramate--L-alanine ligase [Salinibacterium hongtaonis]PWB96567.1 UDP-N-acetylmuramate--L-alanine ligase [Salinibacterium hongtaonis]
MIKSDFSNPVPERLSQVHFVGIGGAGMSGIASMFVDAGIVVTGSDSRDGATVEALRARGVAVAIGHSAANIAEPDALVVTGAIAEDNPEYVEARRRGIPTIHRAQALAWLTSSARLVAVAGAHGKTTSTAMLVTALRQLGADPSFVNGGVIRDLGVSAARGAGELFVVEADESDGSFLLYDTAVALITNVDPDHLDHYGARQAFSDAFVEFASKAREFVAISSDDPGAVEIAAHLRDSRVITFGMAPTADVRLHAIDAGAIVSFSLSWRGEEFAGALKVAGVHNAVNAAGAFAVLVGLGFEPQASLDALATFGGAERRFEFRGEVDGVRVFDDFAHHPTEVEAALSGARGVVGTGRVIPLFQPHLFTRTQDMAQEFADTLERLADYTIVLPIYGARQDPIPGVTGAMITERFSDPSKGRYIEDWQAAAEYAAEISRPGDILVPMGGGDVHLIIPSVLSALERKAAVNETP